MQVLRVQQTTQAFAVWENGKRFMTAVLDDFANCSCRQENCRHIQAVKAALKNQVEIFDELVVEDNESLLWVFKSNAPTPVCTLQFDPQNDYWFNDESPQYVFSNYLDAIMNRCPIGIYAEYARTTNITVYGMIIGIEFVPDDRHYEFHFDNGESICSPEDAILPIN